MKKLFTILAVLALSFTLVGCDGENKIDKALTEEEIFNQAIENMDNLDNFTMEIVMEDVPFFGDLTMEMRYLENYLEMIMMGESEVMYIDGEHSFLVMPFLDTNALGYMGEENASEDLLFIDPNEGFIFSEFTFEDEYYVYNGEAMEDISSFKLKIVDGQITEMLLEVTTEGLTLNVVMTITEVGTTELFSSLDLHSPDSYIDSVIALSEAGYHIVFEADFIVITNLEDFEIMYVLFESPYTFGTIDYNPVTNEIYWYDGVDEGFFDIDVYYSNEETPAISQELLNHIDTIYDVWNDYYGN